ncbi:MAG: hypothetical protein NTV52_11610 [Acidobacteria bacterium]|nr:hypothetical protein [Acidobacteriota bacterium]
MDFATLIGTSPEQLSIAQRRALTGQWAAYLIYTPQNLAFRQIEAIGPTVAACAAQLRQRGLNPAEYEFLPFTPAY